MDRKGELYYYNCAIDFMQYSSDPAVWNLYLLNKERAIQFRKYDAVKFLKALTQEEYIESLGKTEEEIGEFIYLNGPMALKELIASGSVIVVSTVKQDSFSSNFENVVGLTKLNIDGTIDKENLFTDILYLGRSQHHKKEEVNKNL